MTSDFSVDMNEYLPLRDVVFNTLRQAILKGELKPGERLLEIALARFFYGNIFEGDTHLQNIVQILFCDAGYLCTSAWDHHYKTFLLQFAHRKSVQADHRG